MYECLKLNGITEPNFGADYCEYKFFQPKDIATKYGCLLNKGVAKNSNQCIEQYEFDNDKNARDSCLSGFSIPAASTICE